MHCNFDKMLSMNWNMSQASTPRTLASQSIRERTCGAASALSLAALSSSFLSLAGFDFGMAGFG